MSRSCYLQRSLLLQAVKCYHKIITECTDSGFHCMGRWLRCVRSQLLAYFIVICNGVRFRIFQLPLRHYAMYRSREMREVYTGVHTRVKRIVENSQFELVRGESRNVYWANHKRVIIVYIRILTVLYTYIVRMTRSVGKIDFVSIAKNKAKTSR